MTSLWGGNKETDNNKAKSFSENLKKSAGFLPESREKNIGRNLPINQTMKKPSLFTLLLKKISAGMTVEAAFVLPLCIFFLMDLGSAVEMIRLHNNLQLALWDTGSRLALYGYEQGGNGIASVLSALYVKNRIVDYVGEEYLDSSPLVRQSAGLQLWESGMLQEDDRLDITLTYSVGPMDSLVGLHSFRMANRFYVHLWNGYEIPENEEKTELVYVAENGRVYHKDRNCTHLQLSIRMVERGDLGGERNQWGRRYEPCEKCAKGYCPNVLYVTEEGTCFHYRSDCSGLKRTVYSMALEDAAGYGRCSRCGGG